jgi:Ca-activated chloride channel family protein
MNRLIHILFVLACASLSIPLMAQQTPASEWYDRAAHAFVKQDKLTALRLLDRGLAEHPDDPKLKDLAEALLKEEKQQQQQQQDQQQQQGGQGQQDQQQNKDQQADQRDGKEQEKSPSTEQQPRPSSEQQGAQGSAPGQIDPKDARRMLDALQRNERDVQLKVRQRMRPAQRIPIDKDW